MVTFFTLYALQGIVAGFAYTTLANAFAAQGKSVAAIGQFIAIIGLPWILQFCWGPLVDSFPNFAMGKRRPWIVLGLILSNLALFGLLAVKDLNASIMIFSVLLLFHSLFGSLLYVASDGLTVDQVPEEDYGTNSAITRGGYIIGASVSAAVFSWTLSHWGYRDTIVSLLALRVVFSLIPIFAREEASDRWFSFRRHVVAVAGECKRKAGLPARKLFKILRLRLLQVDSIKILVMGFLVNFGFAVFQLDFLTKVIQKDGWSQTELSNWQATITLVSGTLGALFVGRILDKIGYKKLLISMLVISAGLQGTFAVFAYLGQTRFFIPWALIAMIPLPGYIFVAMMPAAMALSKGMAAATQFTLFMTIMNLGDSGGSACSGWVHQYLTPWEVSAVLAIVMLVICPFVGIKRRNSLDPSSAT